MEMPAPRRELPIANAKCIVLKMVLGERLDGRTLMLNMVVGRDMLLTLIGEAIGIGVTALLSPVLSRFLYGVSRVDPLIEKLFHFRHGKVSPYQYVRQTRCAKPLRVGAFRHVFAGCNGTDQHGQLILKLYISQLTTAGTRSARIQHE
jgi:hypothetical protein